VRGPGAWTLGEAQEWSIGEARIGLNYQVSGKQAGYPYAMAEKRGKDRVILKLAKLHGAYSEDEADDFKQQAPAPRSCQARLPSDETVAKALVMSLGSARNPTDLNKWLADNRGTIDALPETAPRRCPGCLRRETPHLQKERSMTSRYDILSGRTDKDGKKRWTKIGAAECRGRGLDQCMWPPISSKQGEGFSIKLEALPLNPECRGRGLD
jgi:hypothetical protein